MNVENKTKGHGAIRHARRLKSRTWNKIMKRGGSTSPPVTSPTCQYSYGKTVLRVYIPTAEYSYVSIVLRVNCPTGLHAYS